jgi:hypothetical protein
MAVNLTDAVEMWRVWSKLRQLLVHLDRLPLRRTLRSLKGLEWGSIWKLSGNVLEERYRVISLEIESLRHLKNTVGEWDPWWDRTLSADRTEILRQISSCETRMHALAAWYARAQANADPTDLTALRGFQREFAKTAGMVMNRILIPAWREEKESLILRSETSAGQERQQEPAASLPPHVRAAEEFFVLPYLAFIQNILGRLRTMALGILWLFLGATLAISSYPFDPLNVLGGMFLTVFLIVGFLTVLVYAQMSRDATLSHITNTTPGELGIEFWTRLLTFGIGPLVGLLTTLFPSITDFVFSVLEPGAQALK